MNRNNTRLGVAILIFVAIVAAIGAFLALGNNSGDANSEPVTSPPVSDDVVSPANDTTNSAGTQDPAQDDIESSDLDESEESEADDVVVDDPEADGLGEPDNDVIQGDEVPPNGLARWCPSVRHVPPPGLEDLALSGVQVNGEIFGDGYQSIELQGPTLNGGEPLIIPINGRSFEAPIGINEFGDHEIETLDLVDPLGELPPINLLPVLQSGPGAVFPVGPDEGPLFEQECFEFAPPEMVPPSAEENSEQLRVIAGRFLNGFEAAHASEDTELLFDTLHPSIPEQFGEETCRGYIDRTVGSIVAAEIVGIDEVAPFELDTPQGPIGFPAVIPLDIEFTTSDGTSMISAAHLPLHNGEVTWLTTCGVD